MSEASDLIPVCKASEVVAGEAIRVEVEGLTLAVFNVDGVFYVTDDQCTHGPGLLHEGYIDGDVVECNFHNGAFHIPSGKPVASPCIIPLRIFPVTVIDDRIYIDASSAEQAPPAVSTSQ
jgi:nitrite reductase/ring-hydroxylating ferredoxin subunit